MEVLRREYAQRSATPSDIHLHLPTLRRYAASCPTGRAAEFGVRGAVSTWALLLGLAEGGRPAPALLSLDVAPCPDLAPAHAAAAAAGVAHAFRRADSAAAGLLPPDGVDLLFIDTWHVYAHLRRELAQHAAAVRRWILLHDTEGDRDRGESLRLGHDVAAQSAASGYPAADIAQGLRRAVLEFLLHDPTGAEWDVVAHERGCNGLTVLARRPHGAIAGTAVDDRPTAPPRLRVEAAEVAPHLHVIPLVCLVLGTAGVLWYLGRSSRSRHGDGVYAWKR